jgi:hypothetical protein
MAIRNNHWYNLNEQRFYPLDDVASATSDQGQLLPSGLIVDLRLRWPSELGRYAFVSAVAVTDRLVTVLIEVTDTLDNSSGSLPLAGITGLRAELVSGRTLALQAFQPGVGGFIVFDTAGLPNYSGRFSTPQQSLLTPRAARPSRRPPVRTVGVENAATSLTGLVNLTAVPPLKLSKATREIDGVVYDNVLVFSLQQPADEIASAGGVAQSVFNEFAGPCGKRVGSRTCGDPQPIESINGVVPDCNGVLTLDFRGCAVVGRNVVDCGVVIDCELGLSQSCDPPYLPNLQTGELPNETPPTIIRPPLPPQPPINPPFSLSESVRTVLTLPYCDTFDDAEAFGFNPLGTSGWGFIADDSPGEAFCCQGPPESLSEDCLAVSVSSSGLETNPIEIVCSYGTIAAAATTATNISLWNLDVQTLFRTYTTDVKIVAGPVGSLQNAGVLLNYRMATSTLVNYLVALLDIDNSTFGVYYFNGLNLISLGRVTVPDARAGDWYRIQFTAKPNPANLTNVLLVASLTGITDPTIQTTINSSLSSSIWTADSGTVGLYARRSRSYFSFWRVDEVQP